MAPTYTHGYPGRGRWGSLLPTYPYTRGNYPHSQNSEGEGGADILWDYHLSRANTK
jgi:hypothetical protein